MNTLWSKPGQSLPRITDPAVIARFMSKVEVTPEGRWKWKGAKLSTGYGAFRYGGRVTCAHRIAYAIAVDAVPDGETVHHLPEPDGSEDRLDVTPQRLGLLSHSDNCRDGSNRRWERERSTDDKANPVDDIPF
jgi:hypothetical protein